MEQLNERYRAILNETDTAFVRYIHDKINWNARMLAVVGERGVGKTTLLYQHIKLHNNPDEALFVSADDIYFADNKLYDTASSFYKIGGKHMYIDEIHKYPDWSRELKMMYDSFPKLKVVFTGSSVLDIFKGSADLSRRALVYLMHGLSFREYLNFAKGYDFPVYDLENILAGKVDLPGIDHPLPLFKEYLISGYYPFFKDPQYLQRLESILNVTLETDIPIYAKMNVSTARKIKQLLYIISQSVPFKPNYSKIAGMMDSNRNQLADFMVYLEKAGVVMQLRNRPSGLMELAKVEKVYLGNTNLIYALSEDRPDIGNLRETFFMSQMRVNHKITSAPKGDFLIDGYTFEVGGQNKKQKQIKDIPNSYIVKDDIEFAYQNTIPLWAFGFNY
ncbi:MAG: AAA family ATPase [Alistipes sp.]|nr:AAA family ATPase [Alistipes sp.]